MNSYKIPTAFLDRAPKVHVIGAGGTGSAILACLAQMCVALEALGAPGLAVTVIDDDRVSPANIGRQAFAPCDVGQHKASVLVSRINQTFGLEWDALNTRLSVHTMPQSFRNRDADIYIGCVDTREARRAIYNHWVDASRYSTAWWLDCGNSARAGQVILGSCNRGVIELPSAAHLFPEMIDSGLDAKDDMPSCSLPEALAKQDLFTNRMIADTAMNLMWQLFRYGETKVHGAFVNLDVMRSNPLAIDPVAWERMGYVCKDEIKEAA